jgi:hypothetical protein
MFDGETPEVMQNWVSSWAILSQPNSVDGACNTNKVHLKFYCETCQITEVRGLDDIKTME